MYSDEEAGVARPGPRPSPKPEPSLPRLPVPEPTRQRPAAQFLAWVLAMSVQHTRLDESTRASLPATMLFHGAIDATTAFVFPVHRHRLPAGACLWRV